MGGGLDYLGLGELIHMQALDAGITPCIVSHIEQLPVYTAHARTSAPE